MNAQELQTWMNLTQSSVTHIFAETALSDLINFLSFTTAFLATTLETATDFRVFSFFCGLRKKDNSDEAESGLIGILKSLNGQLTFQREPFYLHQ